jgi:hypothetical protein
LTGAVVEMAGVVRVGEAMVVVREEARGVAMAVAMVAERVEEVTAVAAKGAAMVVERVEEPSTLRRAARARVTKLNKAPTAS